MKNADITCNMDLAEFLLLWKMISRHQIWFAFQASEQLGEIPRSKWGKIMSFVKVEGLGIPIAKGCMFFWVCFSWFFFGGVLFSGPGGFTCCLQRVGISTIFNLSFFWYSQHFGVWISHLPNCCTHFGVSLFHLPGLCGILGFGCFICMVFANIPSFDCLHGLCKKKWSLEFPQCNAQHAPGQHVERGWRHSCVGCKSLIGCGLSVGVWWCLIYLGFG